VRSVDLAIYADALAGEAATLAARLERARARVRQAAIERVAREELPPQVVARLQALGMLRRAPTAPRSTSSSRRSRRSRPAGVGRARAR
jgi:hypothetical protein